MGLNESTALTLRAGVLLGMALMAIGLTASMCGYEKSILYAGVLVLIASPLAGVVASFVCLLREKDTFWASVAGVLILITLVGVVISLR